MSLGSGAFEGNYSFKSRFEEGDNGTNPEELIAAAHAGCFSMALSLALGEGGNEPESIQTQAKVSLRNVDGACPTITKVALTTRARVPGLDDEAFQKAANAREGRLRRLARARRRRRDHARRDAGELSAQRRRYSARPPRTRKAVNRAGAICPRGPSA